MLIEAANYTRQVLTPDKWCGIDDLLRVQPYITAVRAWRYGEQVQVNLNDFRQRLFKALRAGQHKDKSLVDWMLETHGCPLSAKDEAWLTVPLDKIEKVARVVINRTGPGRPMHHVYQNHLFPWHRVWQKYKDVAVFVGTELEYDSWCALFGEIPHCVTGTLYDAARVIAGADLFIGNQSVCRAIASGMKKDIVLEVWPSGANCLENRPGVINGWDQHTKLPDL